jgi:hypothetical protein
VKIDCVERPAPGATSSYNIGLLALTGAAARAYSGPSDLHMSGDAMKQLLITVALASAAGLALAHNCPNEMKAIDAKLASNPKLSDADAAKVKKLRADGETAHKAGKHDESMKALGEAKKTLGI